MSKRQKRELYRIIAAAVLALLGAVLPVSELWKFVIFTAAYLAAGYDVLIGAVRKIINGQLFDEKFLMSIATLGAFALREYPEAAGVMIFYQIGEFFQSLAVGKSRKSISALMDIRPDTATVIRNGEEFTVSPEEITPGERLIVRPGEKIPLDGTVISGHTTINASALTGESLPIDLKVGDRAVSGSVNQSGVIEIQAESGYYESTAAKILELVENAAEKKAKVESFISRFARWYTPVVVFSALFLAFLPPLLFSQPWETWIERALIFLMVSCPCALVVSIPLSFFAGMGGASKQGILIKGASAIESLSKVDSFIFDKTGTLTEGSFAVEAIHSDKLTEAELLDIAAAAESFSNHPIAESIVAAHGGHIDKDRVADAQELAGLGVKAVIDGELFYVGNSGLMDKAGAKWHDCHLNGSIIHISKGSEYLGHIVVNDKLKANSRKAIDGLKALKIKNIFMLSGDKKEIAVNVAGKLGIDNVRYELMPDEKLSKLQELIDGGNICAFVGDGINDAPALMRSNVGIAMGVMGSDAAIESSDIVLMDDDPLKLPAALKICRRTMTIAKENLVFALGVKMLILILGALGIANMWIAIFGDVGVMLLAVLNAMRAMIKVK